MFMEESRRRDEENRRRDEEREERFLQLLQSIQPQTKAVTAAEGKSDLLPEFMREITLFLVDVLGNHGMQLSDHDKTLLSKLDLETYLATRTILACLIFRRKKTKKCIFRRCCLHI